MNPVLDSLYAYNKKIFRYVPLSSILFGLIVIIIFKNPHLINDITLNKFIPEGIQRILNTLADTIYNTKSLIIFSVILIAIAIILDEVGQKLPGFKNKKVKINNKGKITKIKSYNPYNLTARLTSIFKYISTNLFKGYFIGWVYNLSATHKKEP